MKFKFKIQQYQTEAVEQTVNVFAGQPSKTNAQYRRDLGKRKGQLTFDEEYVGWRSAPSRNSGSFSVKCLIYRNYFVILCSI